MCHRISPSNRYVFISDGRTYASKIFRMKEGKLRPEYQATDFDYGFSSCRIGLKSKPNKKEQPVQFAIDSRIIDTEQIIRSYGSHELMRNITAGYHISLLPNERSLWEKPIPSLVDIPVAFDFMDYSVLFYDGKSISVEVFYLVEPDLLFQDIPLRIWSRYFSTSQERYEDIYEDIYKRVKKSTTN